MTYLYSNPQPITGNVGVLNQNAIVSNANPLPVTLGTGANIAINGNVSIPGNIQVYSTPADPVHVHLSEVGTYGNLTTFVPISGIVYLGANSVANVNATITNSSLAVTQSGAWSFTLSNANIAVTQAGTWNVGITGVPTVDIRSFPGNASVTVSGNVGLLPGYSNVNVSNIPTVTLSSNSVTVSGNIAGINSLPPVTLASNAVTVSGNVNVFTGGSAVSNANPFPVTVSTPVSITGNVEIANNIGNPIDIVYADGAQLGAFGRLRITDAVTINHYKTIYGTSTGINDFINVTSGSGSVAFIPNSSCYGLNVSTTSGDIVIRQTKEYHSYKPGAGQLILISSTLAPTKNNLTQRVGYFDDYNGIYLEHANNNVGTTTVSFNIRSSVGNVVATSETAASTDWNIDQFDGSGPSGKTIDWTKSQIVVIDFQWLGIGRVRCGFDIDGIVHYAHEFLHSNRTQGVYMTNPSLPVRWEIRNTGTTSSSSRLDAICATVASEGGTERESWTFNASTGNAGVTVSSADKGIIAFRLKNSVGNFPNHVTARLTAYSLFATQTMYFTIYQLANVAQIAGSPTWTSIDGTSSFSEYTTNFNLIAGYVANALPINGGFVSTAQGSAAGSSDTLVESKKARIYQNYSSTDSEIIAIVGQRIGNQDAVVYASVDVTEIV